MRIICLDKHDVATNLCVNRITLIVHSNFFAFRYFSSLLPFQQVYVPLDYESRYVGKEVIGVFGYRFGKSGMSLALSALTSFFGHFGIQQLSQLTILAALGWFTTAYRLSNTVPTKAEAEEAYAKLHGVKDKAQRKIK